MFKLNKYYLNTHYVTDNHFPKQKQTIILPNPLIFPNQMFSSILDQLSKKNKNDA
ncbi:hypothetical protein LDENG_00016320 [Lucifuga dentata]|nr:hypothetical protein LDENG_00016320 [Lucifuga dentata]